MSVVWAGTHVTTGREVALKLLKADAAKDEPTRRRMLREARAASAVRHPNVVEIQEVLELEDGSPVLVMDLLRGESLRERLIRRAPLSVQETATLLLPVVAAVGTAHAAGIVHRDLKPENIFLAQEGGHTVVKVLDFGIAKVSAASNAHSQVNALTHTGTMLGTPYYMAPEQIVGEGIDHRADIWSLGVIVYECLIGVRPTEADNIGKILKRVLTNEIEPLSQKAPDLPGEVTRLVDRMLSQSVRDRPASMREVGEALQPFAAEGVTLGELGPPATVIPISGDVDEAPHTRSQRQVSPAPRSSGDRAAGALAHELAETLVAPLSPEISAHRRPSETTVPGSEVTARTHFAEAPAPRLSRWSMPVFATVVLIGGAIGGWAWMGRGRERPPYLAATARVAEPGSGDCPAGMAFVPGGRFRMGSEEGKDDERPVHEVTVGSFCMDLVEVPVAAYSDCMQRGACRPAESTVKWAAIPDEVREHDSTACTAYQTSESTLPMNCVSWTDADAFCKAAGKRLPTEAEWEVAASGGAEHRRFPWGSAPPGPKLLNACDRSCASAPDHTPAAQKPIFDEDDGFSRLAPGGRFPAGDSLHGIHDLAGNVWEWTSSPYCTYPEHACASQHKVFRGGGWGGAMVSNQRTTVRMWSHPSHRYNDVGFRCVKDR